MLNISSLKKPRCISNTNCKKVVTEMVKGNSPGQSTLNNL
jgi:hypothetical protein